MLISLLDAQIGGGESNPLKYCHCIQLVANGPGAYYIHNEIFRLNYA